MMCRMFKVKENKGLHVGPCYELSRQAKGCACGVTVKTRRGVFNAKSGLQLLQAGLEPGERAELCCEGPGAEEAHMSLESFMLRYFDSE